MWKLLSVAVLCAFVIATNGQITPCPGRFEYETTNTPGRWVGTLNLLSDHKLYGTWIRLFFDGPIKDVQVGDNLLHSNSNEQNVSPTEIVLKNWNLLLYKGEPFPLKIAVFYDGYKIPSLTGYRINGRNVCPESDD